MRSLFGFGTRASIENPQYPLTSAALLEILGGGQATPSGVTVTPENSFTQAAVYRATTLISSVSASLPLGVYKGEDAVPSTLLSDPHPELTPFELWRLSYVHRCLWGNSYALKKKDGVNRIIELLPILPWQIRVGRAKKAVDGNPTRKVFKYTDDNGVVHALTPNEVFHVPGLGYDGICGVSPVRMAASAIGLAMAAETSAGKLFASGNMLSGLLQTEQRLTQEQADTLQDRWRSKFAGSQNAYEVAVLDSGASFQSMTMPASDAQMLESRDFETTEIARYFGIPPYLMFQTEKSTSWGTGLEQQATGFVKFDLYPQWLSPTEQRITKELLLGGKRAKYKIEGLLRGDTTARAEFYRTMRDIGAFSANDIRELEDRPKIDGPEGDLLLQPANMVPLGTLPPESASDPSNTKPDGDKPDKPDLKKPAEEGKA